MTDCELVDEARRGDQAAFGELVQRHQDAVFRAALAALGSPEEAEEVAQDAFMAAYSALDGFRGDASFRTWIVTIAWRRALSHRARLAHRLRRMVAWADDRWGAVAAPDRSAEHRLADVELAAQLRRLIAALPTPLRDALLMTTAGDEEYWEVAATLGIPVGTLKWRVSEARRQLKTKLARLGYVDGYGDD